MEQYPLEIVEVLQATPLDRTFILRPDAPTGVFTYEPGQFVVVVDPDAEKPVRRAYSLSSAPSEGELLHMTVRDMGTFGAVFYRFPKGKRLLGNPPQGHFTLPANPRANVLLVSGGSGVTPFRSYAVELAARPHGRRVALLQSAQQPEELIFQETFEAIDAASSWFDYLPTVTRAADDHPWSGRRGRIDADQVEAALGDPASTWFHACGPPAFVKGMLAIAEALGVPKEHRKKEQWG